MGRKVKLTITESKCRSGFHRKGDEFIIDEDRTICPPMCVEIQGKYAKKIESNFETPCIRALFSKNVYFKIIVTKLETCVIIIM